MWFLVVAAAAVVDALATGIFIGKKWGDAGVQAALAKAGAAAASVETKAAPVIAKVEAEAKAAEVAVVSEAEKLLAAQKASAPK